METKRKSSILCLLHNRFMQWAVQSSKGMITSLMKGQPKVFPGVSQGGGAYGSFSLADNSGVISH